MDNEPLDKLDTANHVTQPSSENLRTTVKRPAQEYQTEFSSDAGDLRRFKNAPGLKNDPRAPRLPKANSKPAGTGSRTDINAFLNFVKKQSKLEQTGTVSKNAEKLNGLSKFEEFDKNVKPTLGTFSGTINWNPSLNNEGYLSESAYKLSISDAARKAIEDTALANLLWLEDYSLTMQLAGSFADTVGELPEVKGYSSWRDWVDTWSRSDVLQNLNKLLEPTFITEPNGELGRIEAKIHLKSNDKPLELGQLSTSRLKVSYTNILASSLDNLLDTDFFARSDKLLASRVVSYENVLKGLDSRVNPKFGKPEKVHDSELITHFVSTFNPDTWKEMGRFLKEDIFTKETGKEIVSGFVDDLTAFGMGFIRSALSIFNFTRRKGDVFDPENYKYDSFRAPKKFKFFKEDVSFAPLNEAFTDVNLEFLRKFTGIPGDKDHEKYQERLAWNLFKDFIAKNPLGSQHQYVLRIHKPSASQVNYYSENLFNELFFRIKNISIPTLQRPTVNNIYGHSGISFVRSLQATADNKAELSILCDRNFEVLEYLIRLSGLGVCESGEFGNVEEELDSKQRIYNLSTVSEDSFSEGSYATLRLTNGRDSLKASGFEERDLDLGKKDHIFSTAKLDYPRMANKSLQVEKSKLLGDIQYGKLPVFTFKDFKIANLNYSFKFDSSKLDASLLEIKTTVTWTKMSVLWEDAKDSYYSEIETSTIDAPKPLNDD